MNVIDNECLNIDKMVDFLRKVDGLFNPPLSALHNIRNYVEKILKEAKVYVCEEDDAYVACNVFYCNSGVYDYAKLTLLASTTKGCANLIVPKMIEYCRFYQVKGIITQTWLSNEAAKKLYEKFGFKQVSTVRNRFYTDEPSIVYRLEF